MNTDEAAQVVAMVGQLWPTPVMNDTRAAFYAQALTAIPSPDQALQALQRLFHTERFQPTPGEVIDVALGHQQAALAAWEQVRTCAQLRATRRPGSPVDEGALTALRAAGWSISDLPVDDRWRMEKIREAFIATHLAQARDTAAGSLLRTITASAQPTTVDRELDEPVDLTGVTRRI